MCLRQVYWQNPILWIELCTGWIITCLLNTDKTQVLVVSPKSLLSTSSNFAVSFAVFFKPAPTVRNHGVLFEPSLNFDLHINSPKLHSFTAITLLAFARFWLITIHKLGFMFLLYLVLITVIPSSLASLLIVFLLYFAPFEIDWCVTYYGQIIVPIWP